MPSYDFECKRGHITDTVQDMNTYWIPCSVCGRRAKRIISVAGQYCSNEDAAWLKTVIDVVGKKLDMTTQEFRRHPTRANLKAWMKAHNTRHMEPGEECVKEEPPDLTKLKREVWEAFQKQESLEIRS